ncbi:MAG: protein-disulfide reductase DsbD [Burkholderiales bacterium]|nr:protein-disulfide reductase DsbD [Burkholderiales bacterium]
MLFRILRFIFICFFAFPVLSEAKSFQETPYHVSIEAQDESYLWVKFSIEPEYYLYQNKISIKNTANSNVKLGKYVLPDPIELSNSFEPDKKFVYENQLSIQVPISKFADGNLNIQINYQGCKGSSLCLPEEELRQQINLKSGKSVHSAYKVAMESDSFVEMSADSLAISKYLNQNSFILSLGLFFIFGVLLAFTPCVFPMLPVLIMVVSNKNNTLLHNFFLALSYVLGGAVIYAIAGIVAATLGISLTQYLQAWWVGIVVGVLFIVFAAAMFGYFEIRLPTFIQNKLSEKSIGISSKGIFSTFILGGISTLILSPCVTAPLAGALIYIANSRDLALGASSLFMLGLGSGLPLLLIAVFGREVLPKNGAWMEYTKILFGIVLLAMAGYMLSRVSAGYDLEIILGIIIISIYQIIRKIIFFRDSKIRFNAVMALLIIICIIFYNHYSKERINAADKNFNVVSTFSEYEAQMQLAKNSHKPIVIDFYANWCSACKEMDLRTFSNDGVINKLHDFYLIRVDSTKNSSDIQRLQNIYGVFALPSIILLYPGGSVAQDNQVYGFTAPNSFLDKLNNFNSNKILYCELKDKNC